MTIIQKYGNPTEIRVGQAASVEQVGAPLPTTSTMTGMPGADMMPGQMPGDISGGQPGMNAPDIQMTARRGPQEVTWKYKFPKNKTLEFIINPDGRIMQIAAFGTDWPTLKTSKGIALGVSTYKDLLGKYGFPEGQDVSGNNLVMRYVNKHRVIFTLLGMPGKMPYTVVGVTIGLMD